jgi:prepilin-type N-terminal cleavage/methylation domain-containing protein
VPGFTLIEVMFALGLAAIATVVSVPPLLASVDDFRAGGAARTVAARLQDARVRAITRSRDTALRVSHDARGYIVAAFEDGNDNGVTSADIQGGIDQAVGTPVRLVDDFPGVDFGALPGIPGADGSTAPGSDPVRLGSSNSVTFTPLGTATPGSLYVRGGAAQYVVRIYGETGRTRVLKYVVRTRSWVPL